MIQLFHHQASHHISIIMKYSAFSNAKLIAFGPYFGWTSLSTSTCCAHALDCSQDSSDIRGPELNHRQSAVLI